MEQKLEEAAEQRAQTGKNEVWSLGLKTHKQIDYVKTKKFIVRQNHPAKNGKVPKGHGC
jgi:hypothetical protein